MVILSNISFPAISPLCEGDVPRPFWSVVIPVYNRTQYLPECLNSVLTQCTGEEDMEIIVVDDYGTVPLAELVQKLGQGRVRYHRLDRNYGLPDSWNQAIKLTRGYWTHLLHDDDYVLPGFYSILRQRLESCPESVGAAFTGYENINEAGEITFRQQVYGNHEGIAQDLLFYIGVGNSLSMPAIVVRRTTYEHLGGYHPDLVYTSDWEFYKRITCFYDWWYCPAILARYREHSQSKTSELLASGTQLFSIRQAIEFSEGYLPADYRDSITAESRRHYFQYCLAQMSKFLENQDANGAFLILQEALKIDTSPKSIDSLFHWLNQKEAFLLRQEIALQLLNLNQLNEMMASFED